MKYMSAKEIKLTIERLKSIAESHMSKDGHIVPVGLIFSDEGDLICTFSYCSDEDKNEGYESFKMKARDVGASGVAFVSEGWAVMRSTESIDDGYLRDCRVSEEADRIEVVTINCLSPDASLSTVLPIKRNESGEFIGFDAPTDGEVTEARFSEGIWDLH